MASVPPSPDEDRATRAKGATKARRKGRSSEELPLTEAADAASQRLNASFGLILSESAHIRGRKRRASMLDQTDFEAAFDDIVSPGERPLWFRLMADLGVLLAGILIAYATNVLTGTPTTTASWLIPLLAGVFVTAFCLAIKYLIKP